MVVVDSSKPFGERLATLDGECEDLALGPNGQVVTWMRHHRRELRMGQRGDDGRLSTMETVGDDGSWLGGSEHGLVAERSIDGAPIVSVIASSGAETRWANLDDVSSNRFTTFWTGEEHGLVVVGSTGARIVEQPQAKPRLLEAYRTPRVMPPEIARPACPMDGRCFLVAMWKPGVIEIHEGATTDGTMRALGSLELDERKTGRPISHLVLGAAARPDGSEIALPGHHDAEIWTIDTSTSEAERLALELEDFSVIQFLAYKPDGSGWIATGMTNTEPPYRVWDIDPTGAGRVIWSDQDDWFSGVAISRDGRTVGVSADAQWWQPYLHELPED